MKLLFDENLSPAHANRLRRQGFDAASVSEEGLAGASDALVRSAAVNAGRILVTSDGDFANILRYPVEGTPGVIWLRLHPPTEEKIRAALDRCLTMLGNQSFAGKLVVVDKDKIRVRG